MAHHMVNKAPRASVLFARALELSRSYCFVSTSEPFFQCGHEAYGTRRKQHDSSHCQHSWKPWSRPRNERLRRDTLRSVGRPKRADRRRVATRIEQTQSDTWTTIRVSACAADFRMSEVEIQWAKPLLLSAKSMPRDDVSARER